MKREIIITSDGSTTIHLPDWDEQYHSKHGAIQEAYHVYINNGLKAIEKEEISILEIGFGTGLNCFITYLESGNKAIDYVGVEAYPVKPEEVISMNYVSELKAENKEEIFKKIHNCRWEEKHVISDKFSLTKQQRFFSEIEAVNKYDLIYFDAFGPEKQPELWTKSIFDKMYAALKPNGVLVTYASKGDVKRAMRSSGFLLKRLSGPLGKWHMLRATKI